MNILSEIEHVLKRPDTYLGDRSLQIIHTNLLDINNMIYSKNIQINNGFIQCFMEILNNAVDNKQHGHTNKIDVNFGTKYISIFNNGKTIPFEKKNIDGEDLYIPQILFSKLRSSTNFNDTEKRITTGKNGLGIKLTNIYSKSFKVKCYNKTDKYIQLFQNNMHIINLPEITKNDKGILGTEIIWEPDLKYFNMKIISNDIINYIRLICAEIASISNIEITFNGNILQFKTLKDIIELYNNNYIYKRINNDWEFGAILIENDKLNIPFLSFINYNRCEDGGTHIKYLYDQIIKILRDEYSSLQYMKYNTLKNNIAIFVSGIVDKPSFKSQTKSELSTSVDDFDNKPDLSIGLVKKIYDLGLSNLIREELGEKSLKLLKKSDGKKNANLSSYHKLKDAEYAGKSKSSQCTLILTEGDSAMSGVLSGLSKDDRKFYGVYPLKGKMLNVRKVSIDKISLNEEIIAIKKILGLKTEGNTVESLRYGRVLILADNDLDGFHIRGLVINLFEYLWPELIEIEGFIQYMNTPLIKVTAERMNPLIFYNKNEFDIANINNKFNNPRYLIKYYKGLGTSSATEFREYMKNKNIINYVYDTNAAKNITKAFGKDNSDERKHWIREYDEYSTIENIKEKVDISDFINKEMIHFSNYDNIRSIPNLMDGLKPSQRKILYVCLKNNYDGDKKQIKVAQLSGEVSNKTHYHHGEMSLNEAIVNMAQDYIGSNNIPYLSGIGQFGTRRMNGSDHAQPRYIFVKNNPIIRNIYRKEDLPILEYLTEENHQIEPKYFVPIIPMILVNGCKGIGTGFSTDILNYNINDIKAYIINKLTGKDTNNINIDYNGYKGVINVDSNHITFNGIYKINGNIMTINELPIGIATDSYLEYLSKLYNDKEIDEYTDKSTDENIHIEIKFKTNDIDVKKMKLIKKMSINNMYLFNNNNNLIKYNSIYNIIDEFITIRLHYYEIRKNYIINLLKEELKILQNKVKFIIDVNNKFIVVFMKNRNEVNTQLQTRNYDKINNSYNYLTNMSISSFINENIAILQKEYDDKLNELNKIEKISIEEMWISELNEI